MKTKLVFFFWLIILPLATIAQNLVPNPSFEDTVPHNGNCYTQISVAEHWFNPNAATPDLYTYNFTSPNCTYSSYNNPSGFQLPKTGYAYAGIYTYSGPTRDYIAVRLDSTLAPGCIYYIEFYVSRANNFGLATDKMGCALVADTSGFSTTANNLSLTPAIQSPPGILLIDSLNWIKVSGFYTSVGNEQFLIIGNFYDDSNTYLDTSSVAPFYTAYYYVDDVKLLPCNISSIKESKRDDLIDILFIQSNSQILLHCGLDLPEVEFSLIDCIGNTLIAQKIKVEKNHKIYFKTSKYSKGLYIVKFKSEKLTMTKKIIIQ